MNSDERHGFACGRGDPLMAPRDDDHFHRDGSSGLLVCIECGREWSDPRERWRVYVSAENDDPQPETGAYCPSCAQREFGDPGVAGKRSNPETGSL